MRKQSKSQYPKTMVIIRDCHWSHNRKYNVENHAVELFLRHYASFMGYKVATVRLSAINFRKEATV